MRKSLILGAGALALAFVIGTGGDAEAASCMRIEVANGQGGTSPLMMLVPDAAKSTYAAKGFAEVSCPAGEVYTAERIEAGCQKFENFAPESREAIRQTYGVSTAEICEMGRQAVAEGM